jgi:CheY-like chemotaxis protein
MRVAVFDDDLLTRTGARQVLRMHPGITATLVRSLTAGLTMAGEELAAFDCVLVDVHDRTRELREVGTDVYAGIELIERLRATGSGARVVAIIPTRANPLLTERLIRCGVDYVYERWDFQEPADLLRAVLHPLERFRPRRHPAWVLTEEGLGLWADPNLAMAYYKASPLYGRVRPGVTQAAIGPRRAVTRLRDEVIGTGFVGVGPRPRWNEVRDYLLKLAGRIPVLPRRPPREGPG